MRFSFVGNLSFNTKEDAKVPAVREIGSTGLGINATVVASKNNRAFVEAVGWKNDVIKTKNTDNDNIEIDWKDRFDKDTVKSVANYRKNVIVDGDDRNEFISTYDFCEYIRDNMDDLLDKRFVVTGQTVENFYNGNESKKFQISSLYAIDSDDERKNKLEMTTVVYWTKDGVDTADFAKEKKIYLNGYTQEYLSARDLDEDKGANKYIPIQLVLDCSKIDFENEKHLKRLSYNLMNLGLAYKDGKIVNNLKSTKYYSNEIVISYYNGAKDMGDAESITYDMLTETQKLKVDLGMAKPEDFAAKGRVYGDRIVEFRITDFPNSGNFSNGMVEVDDTVSEFEDEIFVPTAEDEKPKSKSKTKKDFMPEPVDDDEEEEEKPKKSKSKAKTKEEPVEEDEDDEDDFDDLFG